MFVKLEPEPGKKRNRTEIGKRRLKFSFQAAFFCEKRAGGDCGRISYSFSKPVIKVIRIEIAQKKDGQSSLFSGTDSFILIIQRKSFQIRYFHQPAVLQTIARNLNAMRPYQYLRVHPPVFGEWLVSAEAYFFSLYLCPAVYALALMLFFSFCSLWTICQRKIEGDCGLGPDGKPPGFSGLILCLIFCSVFCLCTVPKTSVLSFSSPLSICLLFSCLSCLSMLDVYSLAFGQDLVYLSFAPRLTLFSRGFLLFCFSLFWLSLLSFCFQASGLGLSHQLHLLFIVQAVLNFLSGFCRMISLAFL